MRIKPLLFMLCGLAIVLLMRNADAQQNFTKPGRLLGGSLTYFAPDRIAPALKLVQSHKFAEALPLLKRELAEHPDDLAAFVAVAQCSPEARAEWLPILETAYRKNNRETLTQFKLAVVLGYEYIEKEKPGNWQGRVAMVRPLHLLETVWEKQKTPVIGLLMGEMVQYAPFRYVPSRSFDYNTLFEDLLRITAGPAAYAVHKEAKRNHWRAEPPVPSLTPAENRKELHGMALYFWSRQSIRVGHPVQKNGQSVVVWDPIPADNKRAEVYFKRWADSLVK
jgi:hypothetical protein